MRTKTLLFRAWGALYYAFTRVISFVYVADAAIELLLIAILAITFSRERRDQGVL